MRGNGTGNGGLIVVMLIVLSIMLVSGTAQFILEALKIIYGR